MAMALDDVVDTRTAGPGPSAPTYTSQDLQQATSDFSPDNCLGMNDFATLFKGKLHGTQVVVKQLRCTD